MTANNVFRLAMILSSGQAKNFKTNLKKLIKLVLHDSFGTPKTLHDIKSMIKEQFSLEFTEEELYKVIAKDSGFIVQSDLNTKELSIELHPDEYKKFETKQTSNIDGYILEFIKSSEKELTYEFDDIKEVIYKFLYFSFNNDTQTVLELFNLKVESPKEYCVSKAFKSEEAEIINDFLNWNHPPKNAFVANLISSCYDYCMLTLKKDTNSHSGIFNGKVFYLDSNIIFRLAGFNEVFKQESLTSFITKSTDAGIKICYTNYTYQETKNTIKFHVDAIKTLLGKQEPVEPALFCSLSPKHVKHDFYRLYVNWCKLNPNEIGDFKSFQMYLERKVNSVLRPYELVQSPNYDTHKNAEKFNSICDSLTAYKIQAEKTVHESNIKTDVSNYLHIQDKNPIKNVADLYSIKNYFITADRCFIEWAAQQNPGIAPMFVQPSVWYSLLLKYRGRTSEDYSAFCKFLNISVPSVSDEQEAQTEQKRLALSYILSLNEDKNIKERIIYDINQRLTESDENEDDLVEMAKEAHNTIIDQKVKEAKEETEKQLEEKIKDTIEHSNKKNQEELKKLINNNKKEFENAEKRVFTSGQYDIINKQIKGIAKRNKAISIILLAFTIIPLVVVAYLIINNYFIKNQYNGTIGKLISWYEQNVTLVNLLTPIFSMILGCIRFTLKKLNILTTDNNVIIEKLKKKYNIQ